MYNSLNVEGVSTLKNYFFQKIGRSYLLSIAVVFILLNSAIVLQIVFKYSQFPIYLIFFIFLLTTYQFIVYTLSIGFLSTIIYVINNMRLSGELLSLYSIGYNNKIFKSIFVKISIFLTLFLFLSFHFFVPFTNKFASVILLKNISYMFEPKLIWKNSIELPNAVLSYEKFRNNYLINIKIIDWSKDRILIVTSKRGYFRRSIQFLTIKLDNAYIRIIKNNKIILNGGKKKYVYTLDLSNMISRFVKNVKENNSLALIKRIQQNIGDDKFVDKTSYELGKRFALSLTPFNFYYLGLILAFLIPTTSFLFSQIIALIVVFCSFYSVMVLSSKFAFTGILANFLLPFVPNITLFVISFILFMTYKQLK